VSEKDQDALGEKAISLPSKTASAGDSANAADSQLDTEDISHAPADDIRTQVVADGKTLSALEPEAAKQSEPFDSNASGSLFLVPNTAASGESVDSVESGKQEEREVVPISRADLSMQSAQVSASALIGEIERFLRRYVAFVDRSQALFLALWVAGTHVYEVFDAFGYLVLTAATKRAGKTRLLELLSFLTPRARPVADITPAALFALIEDEKPTLLIDEAERFATSQKDFRAIVNSGYRRGGTVMRRQGDGIRQYRIYCPKVFAIIGDVYDTLRDRSIITNLRRAHAPHRFIYTEAQSEGKELRDRLTELMAIHSQSIADAYSDLGRLEFLTDREEEIWTPLFTLCRVLCPDRWDELIRSAVDISTAKTAEAKKFTDIPQHEDAAQQLEYGERALRDLIQVAPCDFGRRRIVRGLTPNGSNSDASIMLPSILRLRPSPRKARHGPVGKSRRAGIASVASFWRRYKNAR
jgi:hypothetical protein